MSTAMIYSLGSINADFQVRLPRQLQPGETLLAGQFMRLGGGKAANRAFLAHKLGHEAVLIGRVGTDDLAGQALDPLRRAGLGLDHVTAAPGPTAVSMIAVPPDAKKTILLAANANDCWDDTALQSAAAALSAAPPEAILTLDCEVAPQALTAALRAARSRNLRIVLDPAPTGRAGTDRLSAAFALAPDAREAGELTGIDTGSPQGAADAARQLAALGPDIVCIKLTNGGCVVRREGRSAHIPPTEIEVVDATGAGDAFTGALAVALAERMPPVQAALFATAASHCAVTRFGSQESYPNRAAIEAMMARLSGNLHDLPS